MDQRSFQLPLYGLTRVDIECNHVELGVAVLPGLGGGYLHDLGGMVLNHDEATLAESRSLHGEGLRSPGVSLFEFMIVEIGHGGADLLKKVIKLVSLVV